MADMANDLIALKHMTKKEAVFIIGDKEYTMKPLVLAKVRKLFDLIEKAQVELEQFKKINGVMDFVTEQVTELSLILFDAPMDREFAEANISLPLCREMWDTFLKLNMIEDVIGFFARAIRVREAKKQ